MLGKNLFDIEHVLNLFAYSFVHFPASSIYDDEFLEKVDSTIKDCHIYFIGLIPILKLENIAQTENVLNYEFLVLGQRKNIEYPIPSDLHLHYENEFWFLENEEGARFQPMHPDFFMNLHQHLDCPSFHVQYVGQAFGRNGDRNIIERLRSHETLQKISLQGIPDGYRLEIVLIEIHPDNRVITIISPTDENPEITKQRISRGTDKLFNTDEQERVALYEACFIRYFRPRFNIEFRDSFPSTRMKLLQDCYNKDFLGIVAEFCFDEFPYFLCSESIEASLTHVAHYNLQTKQEREFFFFS